MEITTFIFLIILLFLSIGYHGYETWIWRKERAFLIQTFETEKQNIQRIFDNKAAFLEEKKSEMARTFIEEAQKMNANFLKATQESGIAQAPETPSSGSEMVDDINAALKEKQALMDLLRTHAQPGVVTGAEGQAN